jgi:hypothetical protein
MGKEKKPISPFLRAKHGTVLPGLGEGGSGLNKHIRFDEKGDSIQENGTIDAEPVSEVKTNGTTETAADGETGKGDARSSGRDNKTENGHNGSATSDNSDSTVVSKENGLVNGVEGSMEESCEKENRDVNGVEKEWRTCFLAAF